MMNFKVPRSQLKTFSSFGFHSFLFSCLLFLIPNQTDAQSKSRKKHKGETHFTIQGGVFHDWGKTILTEKEYNLSHTDFKKIGLGIVKFKNNNASHFLVEASYYSKDIALLFILPPNASIPEPIQGFSRKPFILELEYFKSVLKRDQLKNNFHAGYILNTSFSRDNIIPYATNQYQTIETCFCLGAGLKAMYVFSIFKKSIFTISTDINLIDLGLGYNYNANPNIFSDLQTETVFRTNLLRHRFGIDLGFVF